MKKEVQEKNIKLTIGELEIERTKAAKKLGKVLEEQKKEERVILELLEKAKKVKDKMKEWEQKRIDEEERIKQSRERQKLEIIKHISYTKNLGRNKVIQIKKLEGINFRIMNGENQLNDLLKRIKDRKIKVEDMNKLIETKPQILKEIELLREDFNKLKSKHSILKTDCNVRARELKKVVIEAEEKTFKLKEEAEKAEYRLTRFDREYNRKNEDLRIYIRRVAKVYKKAFPGLTMKL